MREYTIMENDAGQRLDSFLSKACRGLSSSYIQKLVRQKRIKLNGARTEPSARLSVGDRVNVYVYEEALAEHARTVTEAPPEVDEVYEDAQILLANKPQGMLAHPDDEGKITDTLIGRIQSYLKAKGEWNPERENSFVPALCNRIDRNTGGLVLAAKTAAALREMNEHIHAHEVEKYYVCIVHGQMEKRSGRLENYLKRDFAEKRVYVAKHRDEDARTAITEYRVLAQKGNLSLLECHLITGRTHQIRAQLAATGHPLLGDGKYGENAMNKPYHADKQALYAYKVHFSFAPDTESAVGYLGGKTFVLPQIPLADEFDVRL